MPERARVTSLEAIEDFRAKLIIYRDKAGRVLDEVSDDVVRTRLWLQSERPAHWQNQIRRLTHELERRQQELFSAQLSNLSDSSYVEQIAVTKARGAIRDAEEKLKTTKQWHRQYDQRVEPLGRQVEKLRHTLGHELGQAVAWLNEMTKTLSDYAELSPGPAAAAPAPPSAERVAENPPSSAGAARP